ncbi:MAG: FAD-dependent oxidoreductase [Chitinophagales bacterium]
MYTIIGCGVSGLTTGICLLEAGYANVKIISASLPPQTTSNKAAAIWFPYKAEPQDLVLKWSMESYAVFEALSKQTSTGIHFVDWCMLERLTSDVIPWWVADLPPHAYRKARADELPEGYQQAHIANVPMIETPIYMQYLLQRFEANGGRIEVGMVKNIADLLQQYPETTVVNCTGLGAKTLCKDDALYPIQGHIVQLEASDNECILYLADQEKPNDLTYMMPRKDCIVLGGTAEEHEYGLEVDEKVVEGILERCERLQPRLKGKKVIGAYVGLRPYRSVIRLEKEADLQVIHNYGHGGSGFTVSWGCAKEVVRLIAEKN